VGQLYGIFTAPTPLPGVTPTITASATSGPTVTPVPLIEQLRGTGADGSITVSNGQTYNINSSASKIPNRTCADAVTYSVTYLEEAYAQVSPSPAAGC